MKRPEGKKVLIFQAREKLYDFFIQNWKEISERAIKQRGIFTVALSGGETPVEFYRRLSDSEDLLAWDKTHIFLTDERFVPFDHPDSNYGMIRANLLATVGIPRKNIHPIPIRRSVETSAKSYEENLKTFFQLKQGDLPEFDLIVLGIGKDGHTASIFPGNSSLLEKSHLVVPVSKDAFTHQRITLSLPVINRAREIIFLVLGKSKAPTVKKVLEDSEKHLPASLVQPTSGRLFFLLDKDASLLLPDKDLAVKK